MRNAGTVEMLTTGHVGDILAVLTRVEGWTRWMTMPFLRCLLTFNLTVAVGLWCSQGKVRYVGLN